MLAASVVVHLLLLTFPVCEVVTPPPRATLVLRLAPPPPEPAETRAPDSTPFLETVGGSAAPAQPTGVVHGNAPARRTARIARAVEPPARLRVMPSTQVADAPGEDDPRVDAAPADEPAFDPLAVELFPGDLLDDLARANAPSVRDHDAEPTEERARIAWRIHRYVRHLQAVDRVGVGLIDPYFLELKEGLVDGFDPAWEDLAPETAGDDAGSTFRAWWDDYRATASRYGRTGSPYHQGETDSSLARQGLLPPPAAGLTSPDSMRLEMQAQMSDLWRDLVHGQAGGIELFTLIRVTQSPGGRLLDVKIEAPSGRPVYDRYVVAMIARTLAEPMKPVREGIGLGLTGERIVSLWKFRTRFTLVPPAFVNGPGSFGVTLGCDIESDGELGDCFRPLQRVIHPHLDLIAVY